MVPDSLSTYFIIKKWGVLLMKAIMNRRSIRKYTDEMVTDDQVKILLQAAMAAPSAGNEQPWHFIVIRDREKMNQITTIHPHAASIKQAPVAILVCADTRLSKYDVDYWVQDCAAATENLLLAVQDSGLGAVWLGVYPREERVSGLRQLFNIPQEVVPFSLISIGHPAEQKGPEDRYREDRIHLNQW